MLVLCSGPRIGWILSTSIDGQHHEESSLQPKRHRLSFDPKA